MRCAYAAIIGQAQPLAFRVLKIENCATGNLKYVASFDALSFEVIAPPIEAFNPTHAQSCPRNTVCAAPFTMDGPIEKGNVSPRRCQPIGIEQMICAGVILIDGFLDKSKPERVGIEATIARCISGNGCQMMQPCELRLKF